MQPNDNKDYECICRLKKDDSEAFISLYNRRHKQLYAYISYFIKNTSLAEDILQEVFMKIWEIRKRLDPEKCVDAYFYRITRNAVFRELKKMAKEKAVRDEYFFLAEEAAEEENYEATYIQHQKALEHTIELLPPQRQKIFRLCKQEKKSYSEVAKELNISTNTVKEHVVLALKFIKSRIHHQFEYTDTLLLLWLISSFL